MSNNTTDLSSDFDVSVVEIDAFDKSQLINWASKLELESIDNRTTSIDLMEALSKISKTLTNSLQAVDKHLFQIKSHSTQKEARLKDFIQVSLSEELDVMYSRISHLIDKINELQSSVRNLKEDNIKLINRKVKQLQSDQHQFNYLILEKLTQLESVYNKKLNLKISTPDMSPVKLPKTLPADILPLGEIQNSLNRSSNKVIKTYRERRRKSSSTTSKENRRGETLTRKLIMD